MLTQVYLIKQGSVMSRKPRRFPKVGKGTTGVSRRPIETDRDVTYKL